VDTTVCDEIEGLAIEPTEDQVDGMTAMVGDASICTKVPATVVNHYSTLSNGDVQSLKEYFARPVHLAHGTLSTGLGRLYFFNVGRDCSFVSTVFGTQVFGRLTGMAGMRFTVRVTLKVVATPFHQGIVCLNAQYSTSTSTGHDERSLFGPLSVHLPHVLLDVAESTSVSLDIPYISPYEYNPVPTPLGLVGNHVTIALTKLTDFRVVAGQTAPTYNVYMSLHDIEPIGVYPAVVTSISLQSGVLASNGGKPPVRPARPLTSSRSKVSEESREAGTASGVMSAIADVASGVSLIPGLSTIGGAADWFLRGTAGAIASFGFSKPVDEKLPSRVVRMNYAGDSQVDLPEVGYVVGPTQSNTIAVSSVLGCSDIDEMNFEHILSVPSLIYRGNISTSNATGNLVYGAHVGPGFCWYRDFSSAGSPTGNIAFPSQSTLTTNCILPSTLLYLGSQFRYWRGSLRYTFKFSKSKMHGARALITYTPYGTLNNANEPLGNVINLPFSGGGLTRPDGLSALVDIRDQSTFDFVVPFVYPTPYCAFNASVGSIAMQIIDPLITSNVLSSSIDFLVFVSAEPDFEFASVAPSTMDGISGSGTYAVLQSGVGGVSSAEDTCQHVIGERIKSVKQLIMIPDYNATSLVGADVYKVWDADPWFKSNKFPMSVPMANDATALYYGAKSSRLAQMYSFCQGSTKYVVMTDAPGERHTILMRQFPADCGQGPVGISDLYDRDSNPYGGVVIPETLGVGRFICPLYSRVSRIPVSYATVNNSFGNYRASFDDSGGNYPIHFTQVKYQLSVANRAEVPVRFFVGRAAADDARLACFVGPPPTIIFPSTSTLGPTNPGTGNF